ncbi:DUF5787 family protein [Halostella pelagica]|uniref:DUF5787 family protein n=1 Tax=Halostella pelagica TaxID=2583824 RepID=UPI001082095F|nr:DUF5787 family protein [Halostella pelagica]
MLPGGDAEFVFELRVCGWAERHWPPESDATDDATSVATDDTTSDATDDTTHFVARQLGTKRRRWDTVVVETDPAALKRRARFGRDRLDSDLLHVVRNAPVEWAWYRDALPHPGYPWQYVREAVHRADDRGVLDTRRNGNRIEIRQKWPYPDWVDRIVAIENKPDLDARAARTLQPQLERDIALSLADEVWVATRETDRRVEPAMLEDIPVEAGILTVDGSADSATVGWHPRSLSVGEAGTRITDRPSNSEYDQSAARFEYVDPDEKATKRLEIAERAYERGWRSYADTMRPDCRQFELRAENGQLLPWCAAKHRCQTAAECSGTCSSYEPEPPAWRQRGWPIEGGPGKRLQQLLAERRDRKRPGE